MKKLIALLILITLMPLHVQAASPTVKDDIVVFQPEVTAWDGKTVTVKTTSTAYLYVIQVSDRADFKGAKTYYKRGTDWQKGCVCVWLFEHKRLIWYDGKIISYRYEPSKTLTVPTKLLRQIEAKYQCKKRFSVPCRGRYVRVRCCYYGGGAKVYSDWSVKGR